MKTRQTMILGKERFRVRPWHADPSTAYVTLLNASVPPTVDGLQRCVERLSAQGYRAVVTAALHTSEIGPFAALEFHEYDRLKVLDHDLDPRRLLSNRAPASDLRLRRARMSDRARALDVDNAAFPALWRLDDEALDEAIRATPRTRFRVAETPVGVIGYAVTGRSGDQAFLQRLAVDPHLHGTGAGTTLVLDALQWAVRRKVRRVLVNTQVDNERALKLYRSLGFELTATDLVVMRCELL